MSIWGKPFAPTDLVYRSKKPDQRSTKALVVVTFSTVCPLAKRLIPKLNRLKDQFHKSGIDFVALFPNAADDISEISLYAQEHELALPVFKDDPDAPWVLALNLSVTPEVVVLDTQSNVFREVYRGPVDGQWFGGGPAKSENQQYLQDALVAWSKGDTWGIQNRASSGCKITPQPPKKVNDTSPKQEAVTYYRDILPILQERCLQCHRSGEAGAEIFSDFEDYYTVVALYSTMKERVVQRVMPPWHAFVGDTKHNALVGDLRLTDEQIRKFVEWGGSNEFPMGDPKDAPPTKTWPRKGQWQIGTPDVVLKMPEPYIVPKEKLDEYEYYRIKADYKEDRYIQAIEVRPGNRAVVHHIGAIVGPASNADITGNLATMQFYGITGDKVRKIGDYVPGDNFNAHTYPSGFALKLPKGSDIVMEMHYTPTGAEETPDVSEIGIIWAKEKPEHVLETHVFNRKDVRIPAHNNHYERTNWYQFSTDVKIYALAPHMHYRGKDYILYKVTNPGTDQEKREVILRVPNYDFAWQRTYEFEKPITLKAGDALYGVGHFDNSHFNPHNPDPEAEVKYGLKSQQEMFNLRVKFERIQSDAQPPTEPGLVQKLSPVL
jgi:mono/diheme cytochrome c family protein